ncbi:MAG: hypothetical protein R8P61_08060 [Bacteroidia bacterium]|nr:hypothetical protein [Bacteroidia bacterium]
MISVEKRVPNRNSSRNYRTSIGFTVNPNADQPEGVRVELVSRAPEASIIRMTNDKGQTILHDDQGIGRENDRLEFTVKNLEPGTYFCEVNDGFFCQVKEVRILA